MHGTIHLFDRLPRIDDAPPNFRRCQGPLARPQPLVGLIHNRHSHRNEAEDRSHTGLSNVITARPDRRSELPEILADFAERRVDYIAIDGGDGTVRDVLTCGAAIFGDCWPGLILLPSGKTNALAHDIGIPADWSIDKALASACEGKSAVRRPLVIAQRGVEGAQVRGFVLGAGAFTDAISLAQRAHSWGAFNALAVGATAIWSALQALFGSNDNPWRRPWRMRLRDRNGRDLPHKGGFATGERWLALASTLKYLPAGLRPFGNRKLGRGLRLAVFDNTRRGLLARLPLVFLGRETKATKELGWHTHALDVLDLDVADTFILDGEAFPAGSYRVSAGPRLCFVTP